MSALALPPAPLPVPAPPRPPAVPAAEGLCVWLSASDPGFLREVAEELRRRLRDGHPAAPHRRPRLVSLLAPPLHDRPTLSVVEALAGAAGNLVAQGSTVVVAYPLTGPEERARARHLSRRMADVVVRAPRPEVRGIPVIYRVVTSGNVVEREVAPDGTDRTDPPDIQVDGALGTPPEVSAGILDVLARAGWVPGPQGPARVPPTVLEGSTWAGAVAPLGPPRRVASAGSSTGARPVGGGPRAVGVAR